KMNWKQAIFTIFVLLVSNRLISSQNLLVDHIFEVPEYVFRDNQRQMVMQSIQGNERKNNSLNRLSMISGNQFNYPEPESGCGPIAMLNILVWYEKYGLIEPLDRTPDITDYKRKLFTEIDHRIAQKSGASRNQSGGTRTGDIIVVMDEIIQKRSNGRLRMHANFYETPLQLEDLLETMPNFRAGYIVARPINPENGSLFSSHAMSIIRVDRAGYLTLATWGEKYRGLLRQRNGKQVFVPQDPDQIEFQIEGFYRFIPFEPTETANP
ncbi:MAG: hypothetical protein AAF065_15280, partial [Verrucomicrobiota bacterium]